LASEFSAEIAKATPQDPRLSPQAKNIFFSRLIASKKYSLQKK
jgi:hypothetical protein